MPELDGITGKVTLITGAGGPNMGLAAALLFAGHGARIVVTDVNEAGLQETVRQVRSAGGEVIGHPANVLDEASVSALVEHARAEFGAVHHVLNFAAAYEPRHSTLDCTSAEWDLIVGVTLKGTWLVSKQAMRVMRENPPIGHKGWRGAIITIASAVAHRGSVVRCLCSMPGGTRPSTRTPVKTGGRGQEIGS